VLREGKTVGVVDVGDARSADRIVELMLGEIADDVAEMAEHPASSHREDSERPRIEVRNLAAHVRLRDVSLEVFPGEVVGVVALEGQGQDELFDILSGSERRAAGELLVNGHQVDFRHPADAIRNGIVFVPADRAEALLMQRPVRDNIALPFSAPLRRWGHIRTRQERPKVDNAIDRLQIDIRAQREVRFLSGGNQQKVTIARWVATGLETMLCFDPTRGIDIRTKHQIYPLLRELAASGAAVLLYTSELSEIQLACDRAIVIFGGEVVAEIAASDADETTLLRAAHNLSSDAPLPEEVVAVSVSDDSGSGDGGTSRQ
jgi:ribose transport system ATP-binding protein